MLKSLFLAIGLIFGAQAALADAVPVNLMMGEMFVNRCDSQISVAFVCEPSDLSSLTTSQKLIHLKNQQSGIVYMNPDTRALHVGFDACEKVITCTNAQITQVSFSGTCDVSKGYPALPLAQGFSKTYTAEEFAPWALKSPYEIAQGLCPGPVLHYDLDFSSP